MKPIVQEEITGCGIASVATLAGVTYKQAHQVASRLGISAGDPRLWSETGHVRRLLAHYRIEASKGEAPFVSWDVLPPVALLAIKWHKENGRPFWHWVVFWRGPRGAVVLDPKRALRTNIRTDFSRMKPKWFISVTTPKYSRDRRGARS